MTIDRTYSSETDAIKCPLCRHEHEITGCHETDSGSYQCEKCHASFSVELEYEVSWYTATLDDDDKPRIAEFDDQEE
jgi:transposase-like protein